MQGALLFELDASHMTTQDGVFAQFQQALGFPSYFGANWAALDECLVDLDWLPDATAYMLLIRNSQRLLRYDPVGLRTLLAILRTAGQEWSQPVSVGESWDRPAVPFHSLIIYTQPAEADLQSHLLTVVSDLPNLGTGSTAASGPPDQIA